jgi:hypothetical protein
VPTFGLAGCPLPAWVGRNLPDPKEDRIGSLLARLKAFGRKQVHPPLEVSKRDPLERVEPCSPTTPVKASPRHSAKQRMRSFHTKQGM